MNNLRNSLYHIFLYSVIGASLVMAVGIGYFWIKSENREFVHDSQIAHDSYVTEQKNKVKNVVGHVVQYVKFRRSTAEAEIKNDIKVLPD